ncbi:MAG: diacylglycerol kinase family protein [bacterium]|nr:diacylglycerol kinase family protein [bacterium]
MTKYKSQGLKRTFKNARKGMRLVIKSENNMRVHFIMSIIALVLAYVFNFSSVEFCIVLFAIALVIVAEMFNTAIEFTLDAVYHNKYSKLVGMAKDISAGAVMFSTLASVAVGIILYGKHLLTM